jgi:hypothetical protein
LADVRPPSKVVDTLNISAPRRFGKTLVAGFVEIDPRLYLNDDTLRIDETNFEQRAFANLILSCLIWKRPERKRRRAA